MQLYGNLRTALLLRLALLALPTFPPFCGPLLLRLCLAEVGAVMAHVVSGQSTRSPRQSQQLPVPARKVAFVNAQGNNEKACSACPNSSKDTTQMPQCHSDPLPLRSRIQC
jgi:hypothetical protein